MTDMRSLLLAAFQKHDIAPDLRAGLAALMGGESDFKPAAEVSYAHTSVARIREIFPTRTHGLTDSYIDSVKVNPEAFFELVYGHNAQLGNTAAGDGYLFRGRGLIQLTGRDNYARYGSKIGVDLVANPDRENEPAIAVETAIVYMLDRYHGGGWPAMKAAVGNSFGNVDDKKNALFAKYTASGEWNAAPPAVTEPAPVVQAGTAGTAPADTVAGGATASPSAPVVAMEPVEGLRRIQRIMIACGFYVDANGAPHTVDGNFRGQSITAIDRLVKAAGQPGVIGQKGT